MRRFASAGGAAAAALAAVLLGAWLRKPLPNVSPAAEAPSRRASRTRLVARALDARGEAVPGVSLKLLPGNITGATAADGTFTFTDVAAGTYELTSTLTGFVVDVRSVKLVADTASTETVMLKAVTAGVADAAPSSGEKNPSKSVTAATPVANAPEHAGRGRAPEHHGTAATSVTVRREHTASPSLPLVVVPATRTDIVKLLAARVGDLIKERNASVGGTVRVGLEISTRSAPFAGNGLTADYVASTASSHGTRTFEGHMLGFDELTLRRDVVERAATDIAAYLAIHP